eukprot:UC1_evm1s1702
MPTEMNGTFNDKGATLDSNQGSAAWQALQRLREKQQMETDKLIARQRDQLEALKSARGSESAAMTTEQKQQLPSLLPSLLAQGDHEQEQRQNDNEMMMPSSSSSTQQQQDTTYNTADGKKSPGAPPSSVDEVDERPISATGSQLTFEQLLEQELQRQSGENPASATPRVPNYKTVTPSSPPPPPGSTRPRRPFLRRGQGSGGGKGRASPASGAATPEPGLPPPPIQHHQQQKQKQQKQKQKHPIYNHGERATPPPASDPRQRYVRPSPRTKTVAPGLLPPSAAFGQGGIGGIFSGDSSSLPSNRSPAAAPNTLLDTSIESDRASESSYKMGASRWETQQAQEEVELDEFEQLERDFVSEHGTPTRPKAAEDLAVNGDIDVSTANTVPKVHFHEPLPLQAAAFDDEVMWDDAPLDNYEEEPAETELVIPPAVSSSSPAAGQSPPRSRLVARLWSNGPSPNTATAKPTTATLTADAGTAESKSSMVVAPTNGTRISSPQSSALSSTAAASNAATAGNMSDMVVAKIEELNREIAKFKSQSKQAASLLEQRTTQLNKLRREMDAFDREREQERAAFSEFQKEEMRKLQRERRVFDRYREAARSTPNKQEREEIEDLRAQVAELKSQLSSRGEKLSATTRRYKDALIREKERNAELQAEVTALEQARLDAWGSSPARTRNHASGTSAATSLAFSTTAAPVAAMPIAPTVLEVPTWADASVAATNTANANQQYRGTSPTTRQQPQPQPQHKQKQRVLSHENGK